MNEEKTSAKDGRTPLVERVVVTAALVVCLIGTLIGIGVFGQRVEESSGGALAATATLLAPARTAFSIWSVIYVGLVAYTLWQWLPRAAESLARRRVGWLAAASMLLNAAWLLVTQVGWIWVSVIVILALAIVLGLLVRRLHEQPAADLPERVVSDGTFGLYLGGVTVAACANITAAFVDAGVRPGPLGEQVLAVVVLVVAAGLGLLLASRFGARFAVAAALAWGLAWIAVGRLGSDPRSTMVGVVASAAAAAVVVLGTVALRRRKSVGEAVAA